MRTVVGPPVAIGLVAPIWATVLLTQTTKFIARVGFRYEFDLAAVRRTDAPQLPSLRSFIIHCHLAPSSTIALIQYAAEASEGQEGQIAPKRRQEGPAA